MPYLGSTKADGQADVWYPTTAVHDPRTRLGLEQAGVLKTPDVHHTLETAWKSHLGLRLATQIEIFSAERVFNKFEAVLFIK